MNSVKHPDKISRYVKFEFLNRFAKDRLLESPLEHSKMKMLVNSGDIGLSKQIYVWRWREPVEVEMTRAYLKPGDTILDVGANLGYYVLLESEAIGPKGRILAVEPSPENVQILKKNIELNGIGSQVQVVEGGISDENGTAEIQISKWSNLHSFTVAHEFVSSKVERGLEVNTYRLDDLIEEKGIKAGEVNMIRMDVEGHEVKVMKGMSKILDTAKNLTVIMEIHPMFINEAFGNEAYQELLDGFASRDFKVEVVAVNLGSRDSIKVEVESIDDLRTLDTKYPDCAYSAFFFKNKD